MAYTPAAQQPAGPSTAAFPGTGTATSSTAQLGLPGRWASARVVTAPKPGVKPAPFVGPGRDTTPAGWTATDLALAGQDLQVDPNVKTVDQLLVELESHAHNETAVGNLQQVLWEAGAYGKTKKGTLPFTPGTLDDSTRRAFARAAHQASQQQTMFGTYLDAKVQERAQAGQVGAAASVAQPLRATNPADLEAIAQSVAEKRLGRGLTDTEAAKVTAALTAFEQPSLAAHGSVSPPGAAAFQDQADKQVQALDPARYGARNVLNVVDMLSKSLGGTGG